MYKLLTGALLVLCVGMGMGRDVAGLPRPDGKDYYVKVEVKGNLTAYATAKFDPMIEIKRGEETGLTVRPGGLFGYELLAQQKDHFDLMMKNNGKRIIVTGELERHVVFTPPFGSPAREEVRQIIRVSAVRLAD